MKKYKAILFDADDTLLDFKMSERTAFFETASHWGLTDLEPLLQVYTRANKNSWLLYEKGQISKERLTIYRFERFFEQTGLSFSPAEWNDYYKACLGKTGFLLPGALEVLEDAQQHFALYLITNGLTAIQTQRIAVSGIEKYFNQIYTSEALGAQKPNKEFFDAVYKDIAFAPDETLIVGDSLTSDIAGGISYGVDTCFMDWNDAVTDLQPTYRVKNLSQLLLLLQKFR